MLIHHTSSHSRDEDGRDKVIEGYVDHSMQFLMRAFKGEFHGYLRFLDMGCDYGYALQRLHSFYGFDKDQLVGIDLYFENNPFDLDLRRTDMTDPLLPYHLRHSEKFDVFILNHSLEHVTDPYKVMTNIARLASEHHLVYLGLPHGDKPWGLWEGHYTYWNPRWAEHFMKLHGYKLIAYEEHEFRPDALEFWGLYRKEGHQ